MGGDFIQRGKVVFADPLAVAGFGQFHDFHPSGIIEQSIRRIIKGQVAVLTPTESDQIGGVLAEQSFIGSAGRLDILNLAGEWIEGAGPDKINEMLAQKKGETGRVLRVNALI